jgi:hypothetical protein
MQKFEARMVLEILGRPKEHLVEALKGLVTKISAEKGVKIINQNIHEPIPVEKSNDLFTTFAEIELEIDNLNTYFVLIFTYLPSHVEIITPETLTLENFTLNDLSNNIIQRIHSYDAVAKRLVADNDLLVKKLKEVAPQLFAPKPVVTLENKDIKILDKEDKTKKQTKSKSKKSKSKKN